MIEQRALAVGPHGTALGSPHTAPIVDTYAYDTLHRVTANTVTNVQVVGGVPTTRTTNLRYDSVGNLTRKSDLSLDADTGYTYTGSFRLNRINAPGSATLDFGYDANGNVTARTPAGTLTGAPRRLAIDYDVDNLPLRISTEPSGVGTQGHHFRYGPDGRRYAEETRTNSEAAFVRLTIDGVYERDLVQPGAVLVERWHLAEGVMLVRNSGSGEPQSGVHFIGRDRLGSSTVVTRLTAAGTVIPVNDANGRADHRSYDLYGRPRDAWADPGQKIESATTRGFTEHEHLELAGLIHMNGRIFDPLVGRFYGVDPIIQFPSNSQSLNPYSYILNNPLSGTDPSGYAVVLSRCEAMTGSRICGVDTGASGGATTYSGTVTSPNSSGGTDKTQFRLTIGSDGSRAYVQFGATTNNGAQRGQGTLSNGRTDGSSPADIEGSENRDRMRFGLVVAKDAASVGGELLDPCPGSSTGGRCAGEVATYTVTAGAAGFIAGKAYRRSKDLIERSLDTTTQRILGEQAARDGLENVVARHWSANNVRGRRVYQRSDLIDPAFADEAGRTNLQLMRMGRAPIGPDGAPINLHHTTQMNDSPLAEMTQTFHREYSRIMHINPSSIPSGIDRDAFARYRTQYWQERSRDFE